MFKKVTVILFVLLLLSSCSLKNINLTEPESASFDSGNDNCPNTDDIIADEYRGVWSLPFRIDKQMIKLYYSNGDIMDAWQYILVLTPMILSLMNIAACG